MNDEDDSEIADSVEKTESEVPAPVARYGLGCLVIVLLVLLCAVAGGVYLMTSTTDCGGDFGRVKADVAALETSVIRYHTSVGKMPSSLEDLVRKPANFTGQWHRLVNQSALIDPWKQPYLYRLPGVRNAYGYDVYSKGPDGQENTADDIGNWDVREQGEK